jgi:OOP family OmpA-OmpF porin
MISGMRKVPALLLAASAWSAPAVAQPLEAGGFVGVDTFGDSELGNSWAADQTPGTAPALGGRLAWWAVPALWRGDDLTLALGVEGEASLTLSSTDGMASAGRATYQAPVVGLGVHALFRLATGTSVSPHLLFGGGANTLLTRSPYATDDADPVAYWGGGATWALTPRLGLRLDLRHGLTAGRVHSLTSTFAFTAGLTAAWGAAPRAIAHVEVLPPPEPDPDHDGVLGAADQCPEVAGLPGDGCPERDDDGDGLIGKADACPAQAEDRDGFQDDDGCPDPDNDGDGLDDHVDECPDQPETRNGIDDDDGCPDALPAPIAAIEGPLAVGFERGKARLTRADKRALDKVATALRGAPTIRVVVEGHAGAAANAALTRKRIDAIKWYLVDRGIAADRLDDAFADDANGAHRPARIELHVATAPR